jgi:ABC-type Mn2+/Zn2+ transport system permease subunit
VSKFFSAKPTAIVWSLSLGIVTGVFAHYLLYRLSLPTEPFIYAAF